MFKSKEIRIRLASVVAVLMCIYSHSIAHAQENDSLETLRRFPPNPESKRILEWQIQYGTMYQKRLRSEIEMRRQQIAEKQELSVEIAKHSRVPKFAFATDAYLPQLLSRVLERLLEARVDIAGNEALMKHLDEQLKSAAPSEVKQKQFKSYRDALQVKLQLLQAQTESLNELYKKGAVSQQDLLESRIKIQSLETQLASVALDEELNDRRRAAEIASPLADVRLELHQLKAREKMSELQLEELAASAAETRQLRQFQREIDRLIERLATYERRYDQVSMETEEAKLLLEQIIDATNDHGQAAESENSKD